MKDIYYEEDESRFVKIITGGLLAFAATFAIMLLIIVGIFMSTYNNLVSLQGDVSLAETNLETMIKKRLEIVPNFVSTVEEYTEHEEEIFDDITSAREELSESLKDGELSKISNSNENLTIKLNNLIALVENNLPELKSSSQYINLMEQLENSVNRISVAGAKYNESVSIYNREITHIPGSILASIFGFVEEEAF